VPLGVCEPIETSLALADRGPWYKNSSWSAFLRFGRYSGENFFFHLWISVFLISRRYTESCFRQNKIEICRQIIGGTLLLEKVDGDSDECQTLFLNEIGI
jgi:hypothetical protein